MRWGKKCGISYALTLYRLVLMPNTFNTFLWSNGLTPFILLNVLMFLCLSPLIYLFLMFLRVIPYDFVLQHQYVLMLLCITPLIRSNVLMIVLYSFLPRVHSSNIAPSPVIHVTQQLVNAGSSLGVLAACQCMRDTPLHASLVFIRPITGV